MRNRIKNAILIAILVVFSWLSTPVTAEKVLPPNPEPSACDGTPAGTIPGGTVPGSTIPDQCEDRSQSYLPIIERWR